MASRGAATPSSEPSAGQQRAQGERCRAMPSVRERGPRERRPAAAGSRRSSRCRRATSGAEQRAAAAAAKRAWTCGLEAQSTMASTTAPSSDDERDLAQVGRAHQRRAARAAARRLAAAAAGRASPRRSSTSAAARRGARPGTSSDRRHRQQQRREPADDAAGDAAGGGAGADAAHDAPRGVRVEALVDQRPEAGDERAAERGDVEVDEDRGRARREHARPATAAARQAAESERRRAGTTREGERRARAQRERLGRCQRDHGRGHHHERQRADAVRGEEQRVADRARGDLLGDEQRDRGRGGRDGRALGALERCGSLMVASPGGVERSTILRGDVASGAAASTGAPPARSTSATEEGRAFLQERLAFFGQVGVPDQTAVSSCSASAALFAGDPRPAAARARRRQASLLSR